MEKIYLIIKRLLPSNIQNALPKAIKAVSLRMEDMQKINVAYRGEAKPANVLSFRYDKEYGEILICPSVIRKEARSQKHAFKYQMTWMILHGMLHLSGLHHENSTVSARKFERIEAQVLRKLNIKDQILK